jgi:hypothetical protein
MATAEISTVEPVPPAELMAFARRHIRDKPAYRGPERRSVPRELIVVPVQVQPVDQALRPIGESFTVASRDISLEGIGLVHAQRIEHPRLAIQMRLADEVVKLLAEVVWQGPLGPFEYIGCRAVARLEEFPWQNASAG